jgi:hypothetical protein
MRVIYDVRAYAGKWPGKERRDVRVENESMIVMLRL